MQQWMCWGHPRGCGGGGTPALCSWTPRGLPWDSHFGGHPGGCRGVSPQSCHGARDHPAGGVTLGLPWGWGHPGGVTLRTLGGFHLGGPPGVPFALAARSCSRVTLGILGEPPGVWGSLWGSPRGLGVFLGGLGGALTARSCSRSSRRVTVVPRSQLNLRRIVSSVFRSSSSASRTSVKN